jgi:hypothetical protein
MRTKSTAVLVIAGLTALASPVFAQAQQGARVNVSGSYRCEPQPSPCQWPGQTLSITQTGNTLDLKNEHGSIAAAKLTSDISVSAGPPWNAAGTIQPDHSIQWSNGRQWRKQ